MGESQTLAKKLDSQSSDVNIIDVVDLDRYISVSSNISRSDTVSHLVKRILYPIRSYEMNMHCIDMMEQSIIDSRLDKIDKRIKSFIKNTKINEKQEKLYIPLVREDDDRQTFDVYKIGMGTHRKNCDKDDQMFGSILDQLSQSDNQDSKMKNVDEDKERKYVFRFPLNIVNCIDPYRRELHVSMYIPIENTFSLMAFNIIIDEMMKNINKEITTINGLPKNSRWVIRETTLFKPDELIAFKGNYGNDDTQKERLTTFVMDTRMIGANTSYKILCKQRGKEFHIGGSVVSTMVKNHPFLFYYTIDDKTYLYKMVITELSEQKISYELSQIISFDKSADRPLIISRDMTSKFAIFEGSSKGNKVEYLTNLQNAKESGKFILIKKTLYVESKNPYKDKGVLDIEDGTDVCFKRVFDRLERWSELLNNVLYDASCCIKAFIARPEKVKIPTPYPVDELELTDVLFEHDEDLLKYIRSSITKAKNSFTIDDVVAMLNTVTNKKFVKDTLIRYPNSKLAMRFHPLYHLVDLLRNKKLERRNNSTRDISGDTIYATRNKVSRNITNISFVATDGIYYQLGCENMNNIEKLNVNNTFNILVGVSIRSNLHMKLYHRIGNTCILVGDGKNIEISIIYEYVLHSMFLQISPVELNSVIDEIDDNGGLPYISIEYIRLYTFTERNKKIIKRVKTGMMYDAIDTVLQFDMSDIDNSINSDNNIDISVKDVKSDDATSDNTASINECESSSKYARHYRLTYFGKIRDEKHLRTLDNVPEINGFLEVK